MQKIALARHPLRRPDSGISLVEMLMTIMIIGIIGGLAMMKFGSDLTQAAEKQQDKRNAQEIASTAAMAGSAGVLYFVADDKEATMDNLRAGGAPSHGVFKHRVFKTPTMSDEEVQRAGSFLFLNDTDLIYNSAGVQ